MPYVITGACADSKDTACWQACPVDAIHPGPDDANFDECEQLYIDPTECVDCAACEPACPVEAIFADHELPMQLHEAIATNRDFFATDRTR